MSSVSPIDEPLSTCSTSAAFSTIVPTCGWIVASTPLAAASMASLSRLPSSVLQPASSSTGRSSYPSRPVAAASTSVVAPAATKPSSAAATAGDGSYDGSCSTTGTNPPTARRPTSARVFAFSAGSSGRNPSGPNSVAARPTSRISASTVCGSYCQPHPGTSHTPQEIGAPAIRCTKSVIGRSPSLMRSRPTAQRDSPGATVHTRRQYGRPDTRPGPCTAPLAGPPRPP